MFCQRCGLHFSGVRTGGHCPSCGGVTGATAAPGEQEGSVAVIHDDGVKDDGVKDDGVKDAGVKDAGVKDAGVNDAGVIDETKTESRDAGWRRGDVVAGKYEIIRKIGSGGFGTVYKVRHIQRKKLYALKTPHPDYVRDEAFRKRFEREIEAMERFVHQDMVVVRDSGITGAGVPYYTMDFIEGESLREVMDREGQLELRRALNITRHVLEVLDAAHRHRIIHRDIKPDNVLLTRRAGREVVKVLDFGVAKLLDLVGTATITGGMRVGTPRYMSPEQVAGEEVDGRSDVFAVGIVLYEALTGRHPFAVDRDPIRTTAAIVSKKPEAPEVYRTDLPRGLSDLIMRMLEKKPRRRPQTVAEVIESIPRVDSSASRSVARAESLRFVENAPRRSVSSLVLSQETSVGIRRAFLFFKPSVTLGRSNDRSRGIDNDIILRRLPCRSSRRDAENWKRNLTISHRVASIRVDRSAAVIEPWPDSMSGIVVSGLRSREPVRIQSDRFHVAVGERAIELDGYRVLRDSSRKPVDLSFIPPRDTGDEADSPSIGYSNPSCEINCVRLTRSENHPLHSYFIVARRLAIGSGAGAELRIEGEGVEGHHASLIFDRGELFLIAVGTVRVGRAGDGVREASRSRAGASPTVDTETILAPGDVYPVTPGVSLAFGSARLVAEDIDEWMFKRA